VAPQSLDHQLRQRKLSVGYNRAAKIIDQLERAGLSSAEGIKPRTVLISSPGLLPQWAGNQE
jgi:DNA segregation ATPase FtsK/SpoIIIE-like protein